MALTPEQAREMGRKGGSKRNPNKGFGSNKPLAKLAGRIGGGALKRYGSVHPAQTVLNLN